MEGAKDSEKAPHVYMGYLLLWTALVGAVVLIVLPKIAEIEVNLPLVHTISGGTIGLAIIGALIVLFCFMVQVFHQLVQQVTY